MADNQKRSTMAFIGLVAVVVILIAAALPQLQLKPGIPLPIVEGDVGEGSLEPMPTVTISIRTFFEAILGVMLLVVLVYTGYKVLKGVSLKEAMRPLLWIAPSILVILCILFIMTNVRVSLRPPEEEILPPSINIKGPPLAPMPPGLIWLVGGCLVASIVLLGIRLIKWHPEEALDEDRVKREAELAIHALMTGVDFKNVILRCYRQMSLALQEERGIRMEETMTAREFETLLEGRGLPPVPVQQLTRLFEAARYGLRQPGPDDEQKAIDCLNAIVQHGQAGRQAQ